MPLGVYFCCTQDYVAARRDPEKVAENSPKMKNPQGFALMVYYFASSPMQARAGAK